MMRYSLALLATLLFSTTVLADQLTLSRQVLLPDGKPAVGAKVFVQTFPRYGFPAMKLQSIETSTDRDGRYSVTLDSPPEMSGYVLIDAKGAALNLQPIALPVSTDWKWRSSNPLTLKPEFFVKGRAVDQKGVPVPGATLALAVLYPTSYTPLPISSNNFEDVPAELKTRTDRDGRYSMRGIVGFASAPDWTKVVEAFAIGDREGVHFLGNGQIEFDPSIKVVGEPNLITLNATGDISGRVIDGVTGKPISNADLEISINHEWIPLPSSKVKTDSEGRFKAKGMLAETVIRVAKDGYPATQVSFPNQGVEGDTSPPKQRIVTIIIDPLVQLTGWLDDAQTGGSPLVLNGVSVVQTRTLEGGSTEMSYGASMISDSTNHKEAFAFEAPTGPVKLQFEDAQGQSGHAYEQSQDFDVPATGAQNITIKLHRQPGILFKMDIDDPDRVNIMSPKNDIDFEVTRSGNPGVIYAGYLATEFFFPVDKWGETVTIRILERHKDGSKTDLIPPATYTADPKIWPVTIAVPPAPIDKSASK